MPLCKAEARYALNDRDDLLALGFVRIMLSTESALVEEVAAACLPVLDPQKTLETDVEVSFLFDAMRRFR